MTLRTFGLALAAVALFAPAALAARPVAFDRANFDTTCAPCRDFERYANGGWSSTHTIPGTLPSWGSFSELAERNQASEREVLERAAAGKLARGGADAARLGAFYGSCMDSAAAERDGARPLQPLLTAIDGMTSPKDLPSQLAWLHQHGIGGLFRMGSGQDAKNSARMIAIVGQGGLGLPERDYYFKRDSASVATRKAYVDHIVRSFQLLGDGEDAAKAAADQVMAIETALARVSYTRVQLRDPQQSYHLRAVADLPGLMPSFDWSEYITKRGGPKFDSLNVAQLTFFQGVDSVVAATPVAGWKAYLRWRVLDEAEATLSSAFVNENFRFQRTLSGVAELPPRWKRCLRAADMGLGDIAGRFWVEEHFPPQARERALRLVHNLEAALDDRLTALDWMTPATRAAAKAKLQAFTEHIGYPDKWRDYASVTFDPKAPFFNNALVLRRFETARLYNRIGQAPERGEWFMSAPTVNAFYSPQFNSINFPAGILQPPFFDASWDDAQNYGGIGTVIGHEMSHGFDDSGRQFDGDGNLRDWWADEDAARYKERAAKVVTQFDGYTVLDSLHVNGKLTLGENIGDLGGVALAYAALERELSAKGRPGPIEGFTPEQRFFLSYARLWRRLMRPESMRTQVQTDPHSPGHWRVNGPLSNLDEFAQAFGCKDGDPMVRRAEERARIW